jgi:hypothetical protein
VTSKADEHDDIDAPVELALHDVEYGTHEHHGPVHVAPFNQLDGVEGAEGEWRGFDSGGGGESSGNGVNMFAVMVEGDHEEDVQQAEGVVQRSFCSQSVYILINIATTTNLLYQFQ